MDNGWHFRHKTTETEVYRIAACRIVVQEELPVSPKTELRSTLTFTFMFESVHVCRSVEDFSVASQFQLDDRCLNDVKGDVFVNEN